jgi:hypothetical protein
MPILLWFPTLGNAGCAVILVMVFQTEEYQVFLIAMSVVLIEMGDLPSLDFVGTLQPKAKTTSPPALGQESLLCFWAIKRDSPIKLGPVPFNCPS